MSWIGNAGTETAGDDILFGLAWDFDGGGVPNDLFDNYGQTLLVTDAQAATRSTGAQVSTRLRVTPETTGYAADREPTASFMMLRALAATRCSISRLASISC